MPRARDIENGTWKIIDGGWHKICTGPSHDGPVHLPANDKYFHMYKTGDRKGTLVSRCRVCVAWSKVKLPSQHHGWIPADAVRHFYLEACNRVGLAEVARRTGMSQEGLSNVIRGRSRNVQRAKFRTLLIELTSMRRKNEHSISGWSAWRVTRRAVGGGEVCAGCGTPWANKTEGCKTCWDRHNNWERKGAAA